MLTARIRAPLRLARIPMALRSYAAPSRPTSAPQAALKEVEEDFSYSFSETPAPSTSASVVNLQALNPYDGSVRQYISLPPILPSDSQHENTHEQHQMYQSTGAIDSASMIAICLRRKEHIPRAYQIFRQTYADYEAGSRARPEAELYGRVIEGITTLAVKGSPNEDKWRSRAEGLIRQWERSTPRSPKVALKKNRGIKVYQGWFSGLVLSESSLAPLIPYLENGSLSVEELISGVRPADVDRAYEALRTLARISRMEGLASAIKDVEEQEKEAQERASRDVPPELRAIKDGEGGPSKRRATADIRKEDATRFSITNLRTALEPLTRAAPAIVRQRELEVSGTEAAIRGMEHSRKEMSQSAASATKLAQNQLQSWMYEWTQDFGEHLKKEIEAMSRRVGAERQAAKADDPEKGEGENISLGHSGGHRQAKESVLVMYLSVLPPEKLALITVLEMMRGIGSTGITDGMKAIRAISTVGKGVETEYQMETIRSISGPDSKRWQDIVEAPQGRDTGSMVQYAWEQIGKGLKKAPRGLRPGEVDWSEVWTPSWTQRAHLDVGSWLVNACMEVAKVKRTAVHPKTREEVTEQQPAFVHTYEYVRGKKLGVIRLNPAVASRMGQDRIPAFIKPNFLPMLVEPRPWTAFDIGGYLTYRTPIMRTRDDPQQVQMVTHAINGGTAEAILHSLDVLSSTSWKVNRRVFDVVAHCWNEGQAIADIPASEVNSTYTFPEKPSVDDHDVRARSEYIRIYKETLLQQRKDHGERCKINYTLEVARGFLHDPFYLPHNMDFRGRCYPIPPYLNPLGDDLNRGLLLFGEGRALGETGLRWLQIHLANVYGYDKLSFDERARFAEDHYDDIMESADHPLDGSRWWLKAEDPWQCLATCFELADALRSPDPKQYVSHFPVHQDGTCNGMQHYAALGGDIRGARAVNLEAGDRPADIHTRVVEIANKVVEGDKLAGNEVALLIKEPLTRKIVKQTVMTTVYGVTFVGARDQIGKQLLSRTDIDKSHVFMVSAYLAKTILSCIGDLFSGAKDIQDWLVVAARLISRSIAPERVDKAVQVVTHRGKTTNRIAKELMSAVTWTTPLGLPVVQPYRKPTKRQVMTALQTVYVADPNQPAEVSPVKQATAFPPNFVHSLDATHMMLTALECKRNGIVFASVHDSYWTHPSTVDAMSDMIRDRFIKLHRAEIINELRDEFLAEKGDNLIPVASAKAITESVSRRNAKETARRREVRAALGESDAANMNMDEATTTSVNLLQAESEVLGDISDVSDVVAEDEDAPVALTEREVEELVGSKMALKGVEVHDVKGHKFVKLRDLLPPPPVRGNFDVEKIRDSKYFFS